MPSKAARNRQLTRRYARKRPDLQECPALKSRRGPFFPFGYCQCNEAPLAGTFQMQRTRTYQQCDKIVYTMSVLEHTRHMSAFLWYNSSGARDVASPKALLGTDIGERINYDNDDNF